MARHLQKYLFNSYKAQEMLDLALALSTFEHTVQLLFIDSAVLQLLKNQQPNLNYRKDFITTFKALAMYDINDIYVDEASLAQFKLSKEDLIIDVTIVNKATVVKIIRCSRNSKSFCNINMLQQAIKIFFVSYISIFLEISTN